MSAETRGELHCRSKQIVILLDRFSCCGADSHLKRMFSVRFRVLVKFALNLNCASHCTRCRNERCHDSVPGMLYFAPALRGQGVSHNRVVHAEHCKGCFVAERLSQWC